MPKIFTSKTQKTGEIGENIAVRFLMKHGFYILERNYTEKWGELDIIAEKDKKIHFVEVKSVTSKNLANVGYWQDNSDNFRPEDNMHPGKMKRLSRAVQTYILNRKLEDREWQLDLLVIFLDVENKQAKVKVVSNIIL